MLKHAEEICVVERADLLGLLVGTLVRSGTSVARSGF